MASVEKIIEKMRRRPEENATILTTEKSENQFTHWLNKIQ